MVNRHLYVELNVYIDVSTLFLDVILRIWYKNNRRLDIEIMECYNILHNYVQWFFYANYIMHIVDTFCRKTTIVIV